VKHLILIRGPSAAGKTSLAVDLHKRIKGKVVVLHKDFFHYGYHTEIPHKGKVDVKLLLENITNFYLKSGFSVIVDGVYGGPQYKANVTALRRIARKHKARFIPILIHVSLEKCLKRNIKRGRKIPEAHVRKWYGWLYKHNGKTGYVVDNDKLTRKQALSAILKILR